MIYHYTIKITYILIPVKMQFVILSNALNRIIL